MMKPPGMDEWDGYPMPKVPKDRKPLSKEEEERIGRELRENVLKHAKITRVIEKEQGADEHRKIG